MEKVKYFILGAVAMLLFLFLIKGMFSQSNIGRYQIMTVQQDVRWVWMVDTKTGVATYLQVEILRSGDPRNHPIFDPGNVAEKLADSRLQLRQALEEDVVKVAFP